MRHWARLCHGTLVSKSIDRGHMYLVRHKRLIDISHLNLLSAEESTISAIRNFEVLNYRIICVVDLDNKFIVTVTEVDVRLYLLRGGRLEDRILSATNLNSFFCRLDDDYNHVISRMNSQFYKACPVLNEHNIVIGLLSTDKPVVKKQQLTTLIMAGGLGTRLKPITDQIPKPLVQINGKPIILKLIEQLVSYGLVDITISIWCENKLYRRRWPLGHCWFYFFTQTFKR